MPSFNEMLSRLSKNRQDAVERTKANIQAIVKTAEAAKKAGREAKGQTE